VADKRITVIYYGPDETKFDPSTTIPSDLRVEFGWSRDVPLIGMVAYFYAELPRSRWIPLAVQGRSVKDQESLVRAATTVLRDFPLAKILLVGSGWEDGGRSYLLRMKKLVRELGLEQSIIFTGFRTDIAGLLRALDIAVQPSLSENLGGTIESLLMECPTIATRVGGLTDSVVDGQTGILVNPSDPESLADGILRMLRSSAVARQYGVAGRQRMLERFTLRRTVDDLAALYEHELESHPGGYRPWVIRIRFAIGSLLCFAIAARYVLFEATILPFWDEGLRVLRKRLP
jgi:glycosyltransferase involved in cell wall biosynthesis